MAVRPASLARPVAGRPFTLQGVLEREGVFSWLMLSPGVLFLLAFIAYPFFYGIFLSLEDRRVATPGVFVGFANFQTLRGDAVFWQITRNTFVYVAATTVLKLAGGLAMALVMNQSFRGRNLARAFLLLPFIVPTALSTVAWMWILDPTFSVVNWLLVHGKLIMSGYSFLGNATLALRSLIVVNTWRGMPFYGITLLAGLPTISSELYEARAIGGRILRLYLPLAMFIVGMLFPFYWMLITSIKPNRELYNAKIMPLIVYQPTLKHYVDLLYETNFLTWTYNTMLVAIVTTVVSLVIGTMMPYPLARLRFPGTAG